MTERNDGTPHFEIPDLELEPSVSKRPAQVAPRAAAPAAQPAAGGASALASGFAENSFGGDDDDFELIKTGAAMDLDAIAPPPAGKARVEVGAWPSGRSRPIEQLQVDAHEVSLVADYGPAPRTAILTPLYAYRVYTRRVALTKLVTEHHAALVQAESARDLALAQLASELRAQLEASDVFRRLLDPIREIEKLAGDRSAALSEADTGYREQMGRFDTELAQLRESAQKAGAVVTEKTAAAEHTHSALQRAEAKHKRVQIEIRGVLDVARQAVGPAGGDIPAPQAAKLAELQARSLALEPELSAAKSAHAVTSQALEQAETELRRFESQSRQLERQKSTAAGALAKQLNARAASVSDVEQQRVSALADVARAVLAARGTLAVSEPSLELLRGHDRQVETLALRLETHVRARDSQDNERVRQGVILALSAIGLVVLAITLKAVL